ITITSPVIGSSIGSFVDRSLVAMSSSVSLAVLGRVFHRRASQYLVRVGHFCDVSGPRARIQIGNHAIVTRLRLNLGHAAVFVVDVAESDRIRRAGLLAGGDDLPIANLAILLV